MGYFEETSNVSILSKSMPNITSTFMEVKPMSSLPIGNFVLSVSEVRIPRRMEYEGEYIALSPLDPEKDAPGLFACSHGTELVEQLWTYMAYGPFEDVRSMQAWLEGIERSEDPLFFSVRDKQSGRPIGMVSFLNVASDARRWSLGISGTVRRHKIRVRIPRLCISCFARLLILCVIAAWNGNAILSMNARGLPRFVWGSRMKGFFASI